MSDEPIKRIEPQISSDPVMQPAQPAAVATPSGQPPLSGEAAAAERLLRDQLARIEDKLARVEEKFARSENQILRMEDQVAHMHGAAGNLARQDEVERLSRRVGRLPGFGTLIVIAILAAVMAAAFTILAQRFGLAGLIP